jgi:DNA (cytosine-5)-methyltransferase 1
MARIIHEVRPRYVFVENSPMLTSRGLGRVLGDLASMGFDAKWGVLGAADVGANHQRDRIWIVGKMGNPHNYGQIATKIGTISTEGSNSDKVRQEQASQSQRSSEQYAKLAYADITQRKRMCISQRTQEKYAYAGSASWWKIEPNVGRVVDGLASGNDRLKAIGNGQVPLCAATAWRILNEL